MVGMSKEQVLTCMGPPASKTAEGQTEVWSYNSGDGTTFASGSGWPLLKVYGCRLRRNRRLDVFGLVGLHDSAASKVDRSSTRDR